MVSKRVRPDWMPSPNRMVHEYREGIQAGLDNQPLHFPDYVEQEPDTRTRDALRAARRHGYNRGMQAALQARYGEPVTSRRDGS